MGKVATKAMRIARGTTLTMGVAVMLALVLGVATTALAGTGVGARFDLGKTNTVNAITKLVGSVAGPSLVVDNNSADANATALELQVQPGKAPMKVDSAAQVANLNSDKLDGKDSTDFMPKTYEVLEPATVAASGGIGHGVSCDLGDVALSGGYVGLSASSRVVDSHGQFSGNADHVWLIKVINQGQVADEVTLSATCADYEAPHQ